MLAPNLTSLCMSSTAPNPLGGMIVDGNVLDSGMTSFVSIIPIPYVHGCTFGELATMINKEGWLPTAPGDSVAAHLRSDRGANAGLGALDDLGRHRFHLDTNLASHPHG